MNLWNIISALLLTLGLSSPTVSYLSTVEVFNQGDQPKANIQREAVVGSIPQKKNNSSLGVKITAAAAAVMDENSGAILWQKSAKELRPLASITKLMTALVFVDNNPGWEKTVVIEAADRIGGDIPNIVEGEEVTIRDLFYTSLIASDNNATKALVRSTGLGERTFVEIMNARARSLGLANTFFTEPVGLNPQNSSTALEILVLAKAAFAQPDIKAATALSQYDFAAISGQRHVIKSTNNLLKGYLSVKNGKTGFTEQAGYCLVVRVAAANGENILTVVLGSATHENRFQDAKILSAWILENFNWP